MSYWVTAYLALGSNMAGERSIEDNLRAACWELAENHALRIFAVSSVYRSRAWGNPDQHDFLNAVIGIETLLTPRELLRFVKKVEVDLGRQPTYRWGPRVIDVDIVLFGLQEVKEPDLVIPHRHLLERAFVYVPLLEIAPDVRMPDGRELRSLVSPDVAGCELERIGRLTR